MKKLIFILSILITGCSKEEGCTDITADNWDVNADIDDGSCYYLGCTDYNADNYDSKATKDDGSCYKLGCMNSSAYNYDQNATDNCCCEYSVQYVIGGSSGLYDITYENSNGGTSQESNVGNSWFYSFSGGSGDFVYISAQNQNSSGSVTVTIKKGGTIYKTSTSSGAYVIATASGSL
ncbi:MAG: hypothetical protein ACUZ8H_03220 [Candidatus Anammoxibacter sp.]